MNVWQTPLGKATIASLPAVESKANYFDSSGDLARLLGVIREGVDYVTPETCMESPTVHAIVTAVSRRLSVTPVHVYERTTSNGRESKKKLPNHPVAKLLDYPNKYQTRSDFWADAASTFVRWGRFYAFKSRGQTGPIQELIPLNPCNVNLTQDANWNVTAKITHSGGIEDYPLTKLFHARGPGRNFYEGDSPIKDVARAIALEIAAEKFGTSFFNNGAVPLMVFKYMQGVQSFKSKEAEEQFISDFQRVLGGAKRHNAFLVPKGIEMGDPVKVENDKAQFLETRKYQRTVIAGALGVPPHMVGDLERATFNNVEQQDSDFTLNCILPVTQAFESAMERDLFTEEDYRAGRVIRFNLDSILRADFKSRQEGLQIQRLNGVISSDEWREIERLNPITGKGGSEYWRPANMTILGTPIAEPMKPEPPAPPPPKDDGKQQTFNLQTAIHINNEGDHVTVKGGETTVKHESAPITIENKAPEIQAPAVNIAPPDVIVNQGATTVNLPQAEYTIVNDVKSPVVNVAPAEVKVDNHMGEVNVAAPNVQIDNHNHLPAAEVKIDNHVQSPTVNVEAPNVTFEATMPETKVEIQPVIVSAPAVTVKNEMPTYEVSEQKVIKDKDGRVDKIITKRKRSDS